MAFPVLPGFGILIQITYPGLSATALLLLSTLLPTPPPTPTSHPADESTGL